MRRLRTLSDILDVCGHLISPEPNTGCWLWTGRVNWTKGGYGQVTRYGNRKRIVTAHRYSWELSYGPIPEGKFVLHKCDVPSCVNPEHLFVGVQLDNVRDCVKKGRVARGESISRKLTAKDVVNIRMDKRKTKRIAYIYGVSVSTVSLLKRKKLWRHLP